VASRQPSSGTPSYLEEAETKGLDNKDYDGARWPYRVKALQSGNGVPESGRVKLDVTVTV
jgi:hypothetical protein